MSQLQIENLGELPNDWLYTKLEEIAEVIMGQSPPGDTYNQEGRGFPLINGPVEFGPTPFSKTLRTKFTTQPTKLCQAGDLILCVRGSTTGRMNIAGFNACIGRGVSAIRAQIIQPYVNFYIHLIEQDIFGLGTGSTFPNVSSDILKNLTFPLAPLAEQQRIVAAIETHFTRLDTAVATLHRLQANLKRYRAAVLKAACEGRLVDQDPTEESATHLLARILAERRSKWQAANPGKKYQEPTPSDMSELPELPEGWMWTNIEQLGKVSGGLTKNQKRSTIGTQLPYLRVANVYANRLELDDIYYIGVTDSERSRVLLNKNDLLVVEGNGSPDQIGRVAIWNGSIPSCVHQNHLIKVRFEPSEIANFVLYWLLSLKGREQIRRVASSTSGLHTLSLSKVSALYVPLPPLAEQTRIVAEVERRLSVIDQHERAIRDNLARAARLRQSILKRAFSGRLVPQDTADEPASVLLERIRAQRKRIIRNS